MNNFVLNNVLKKYEDFVGGLCLNKKNGVYAIDERLLSLDIFHLFAHLNCFFFLPRSNYITCSVKLHCGNQLLSTVTPAANSRAKARFGPRFHIRSDLQNTR